jgi:hypothetical protein
MPAPPRRTRASSISSGAPQTPEQIATAVEAFLAEHPATLVMEESKTLFDLRTAQWCVAKEHGRCTLQLWDEQQNIVRRVVATEPRGGATLRLSCMRFGKSEPQSLDLVADRARRSISTREATRERYLKVLETALVKPLGEWKPERFRTAMDLERSFGPAYARGVLTRGQQEWAVIGCNAEESAATIDGILTLGILWLDLCRTQTADRPRARLVQGLHVVVPTGTAATTLSRMAWLNERAAQWRLWELDERAGELTERELADVGNLDTRLVHAPDETAAGVRFAGAVAQVLAVVPDLARPLVEQRLRSSAELAFLWNGLEFARARQGFRGTGFRSSMDITFGTAGQETPLTPENEAGLRRLLAELVARRAPQIGSRKHPEELLSRASEKDLVSPRKGQAANRASQIGSAKIQPTSRDPLYRMQPERWLESMLRRDLAPLTRGLTHTPDPRRPFATTAALDRAGTYQPRDSYGDVDGNVADVSPANTPPTSNRFAPSKAAPFNTAKKTANTATPNAANPTNTYNAELRRAANTPAPSYRYDLVVPDNGEPIAGDADGNRESPRHAALAFESRVIPRLNPEHVYAQVPAIAGAGDRGMLDLLGITDDGRLAVIELKAEEDLHLALQGLDYWLRVRQHHLAHLDPVTGLGEFQRHGYFPSLRLSPEPPRLYLVAPALRIHPAVESVLRYLSPRVDWQLIALDERWRETIKVVWRKMSAQA